MTLYFDPAARVVAVTPAPAVVKVPAQALAAGYFDPAKPRLVRSKYPTAAEIAALVASFDAVTLRSLEMLKALNETVEENVRRRIGYRERCAGCGALGGGEFGHRSHCPEFREHKARQETPWLFRRRVEVEEGDPDDDLPF